MKRVRGRTVPDDEVLLKRERRIDERRLRVVRRLPGEMERQVKEIIESLRKERDGRRRLEREIPNHVRCNRGGGERFVHEKSEHPRGTASRAVESEVPQHVRDVRQEGRD